MTKIRFLGTGANGGTPEIDCRCPTCLSGESRLRSCVFIQSGEKKVILDCGPDFRSQLIQLNLKLDDLSAICLTHLHWDHSNGLYELSCGRRVVSSLLLPIKLKEKINCSEQMAYLSDLGFVKFLEKIEGIEIKYINVKHDPNFDTFAIKVTALNKSLIYVPDIAEIEEGLIEEIKTVDLVIFDGTFLSESKLHHLAVKESLKVLSGLGKKVIYSHINHSEDISEIESFLKPFGFEVAFDGLEIYLG